MTTEERRNEEKDFIPLLSVSCLEIVGSIDAITVYNVIFIRP